MILLLGESHDDVLYFESIASHKRQEMLFGRFPATYGTIYNQEALIVEGLYGNSLAGAVTLHLLENNITILVIAVGKCTTLTGEHKEGEIVVSKKIVSLDADFSNRIPAEIGAIPGVADSYTPQDDILEYMENALERRTYSRHVLSLYLSSENERLASDPLFAEKGRYHFGESEDIVIDSNSAGIAMACKLKQVPMMAVKVVERTFGKKSSVDHYANVLEHYVGLGKAVTTLIGDIGRNDLLVGEAFE